MDRTALADASNENDEKERGAALILVALTLVIVMISGALAVDLSATSRRGQTLQNAADAAALAGVRVWVETGNATDAEAAVADILNQNGVAGGGTSALITFPTPNELDVTITDADAHPAAASITSSGMSKFEYTSWTSSLSSIASMMRSTFLASSTDVTGTRFSDTIGVSADITA